jgi:hypothetical protein
VRGLTRQQLEGRKAQAVRFARDVREDDDLADAIQDETLDQYAERRHIKLSNPTTGARKMPIRTRRELLDRISELEEENQELREKVDSIAEIVGEEDDESEDQDEDEDGGRD